MAFEKKIPTNFGVDAEYWRIIHFSGDILSGNGTVVVAGYVNKAARDENRQPLAQHTLQYINNEFSLDDDRAAIYRKLRERGAPWNDAQDV